MSDVQWVKIMTDMFDNRKIKHIRKLPEGNNIILIWVMLLSLAGRCNASGMIFLTENIPYTNKMLADELGFEESVICMSLEVLERFRMISRDEEMMLSVNNWDKYQNIEGMDRIREQNRIRKQRQRERQKRLDSHVTSRDSHATDIDIDKDIEEDIEYITISKDIVRQTEAVQRCVKAWNSLSDYGIKTISRIGSSSQRYQRLVARIKEYGIDSVLEAIERIKHSKFLCGKSNSKQQWVITFDWFVLPNNFPKVLDGNYDDKDFQEAHDEEPEKQESNDRFSCLDPVFRTQLQKSGVIDGQSLILGNATETEIQKLQKAGVL